jgi:uncharacterized protein DUF6916
MTVPRRNFLRLGAMTVFVTAIALDSVPLAFAQKGEKSNPAQDFQIPTEAAQAPIFYFKRETFQPYVGGIFKLSAGANSVEATLVSVRDCTPSPKSHKLTKKSRPSDSFALVFRAEGKLTDLTTIYDVEHGALGKFALFLTLRDGPQGTYFYEAVFNHAL